MNFVYVAFGAAIGAVLRYAISLIPCNMDFPILTLAVNLIGAVLIGIITGVAMNKNVSEGTMLFLKTGLCGGFTTFSTFSLEAYDLFKDGKNIIAILYAVLSVGLCIAGVLIGTILGKRAIA